METAPRLLSFILPQKSERKKIISSHMLHWQRWIKNKAFYLFVKRIEGFDRPPRIIILPLLKAVHVLVDHIGRNGGDEAVDQKQDDRDIV